MIEPVDCLPPSPPRGKPTLSVVARAAKVSLATASYALRHDPKIPSATRERVSAIARKLGYQPDPELGRLMFLLRRHTPRRNRLTAAVLSVGRVDDSRAAFHRRLLDGLRLRGDELGFDLDPIEVDPQKMSGARLTQILLHRGVKGVILASLARDLDCANLLDWAQFPTVATTGFARNLNVCRVVPHHLQNAGLGIACLRADGHRRVGWIVEGAIDRGPNRLYLAAKTLAEQSGESAPIPILTDANLDQLPFWIARHRPDAVLASSDALADHVGRLVKTFACAPPALHTLDLSAPALRPGIDQHPETIGTVAIDMLSRLIQSGQCGPSGIHTVTMVEGSWNPGPPSLGRQTTPANARRAQLHATAPLEFPGAAAFA